MNDRPMTRASRTRHHAVRLLAVLGMAAALVVSTGGGAQASDGAPRSPGCEAFHDGAFDFTGFSRVVSGDFDRGETIQITIDSADTYGVDVSIIAYTTTGSDQQLLNDSPGVGESVEYTFEQAYSATTGYDRVSVRASGSFDGDDVTVDADCSPAADLDPDGDGVVDDACDDTPSGAVVDDTGCSVDQLVPCDGSWKNHGKYVAAFAKVVDRFEHDGLLSPDEADAATSRAAESDCAR